MPKNIKITFVLLLLSAIATIFSTYLDSLHVNNDGRLDPMMIGLDFGWFCIMVWIIHSLWVDKADIRTLILFLLVISATFIITSLFSLGISLGVGADIVEAICLLGALTLLNSQSAKAWYQTKAM